MFLALLSAGYMLGLLTANACVSESKVVPERNETIVYKCYPPNHGLPMTKDETRVPATVLPPPVEKEIVKGKPKKVSHRCGPKTPVWYTKDGNRRYRCK